MIVALRLLSLIANPAATAVSSVAVSTTAAAAPVFAFASHILHGAAAHTPSFEFNLKTSGTHMHDVVQPTSPTTSTAVSIND